MVSHNNASSERLERHFRIGVVNASISTPIRRLLDSYTELYQDFQTDDPQDERIHIEIKTKPFSLVHRRRYEIYVNGRLQFEPERSEEIVPFIDWAVNWEVPRVMPEYLHLHASSMEVDGVGVIFPGQSGSGKSTLTAGLLARGWRYLCDEFAVIHAETLKLHPYPRAICIKKGSYPVVDSLGLRMHRKRHLKRSKGWVGFINPCTVRPDAVGRTCPIRYVVFPKYVEGAQPSLTPMSRGEAAFALHEVCFNLFGCQALGLDVIAGMIRGAKAYRLVSGEIGATCDVVRRLVEQREIVNRP